MIDDVPDSQGARAEEDRYAMSLVRGLTFILLMAAICALVVNLCDGCVSAAPPTALATQSKPAAYAFDLHACIFQAMVTDAGFGGYEACARRVDETYGRTSTRDGGL